MLLTIFLSFPAFVFCQDGKALIAFGDPIEYSYGGKPSKVIPIIEYQDGQRRSVGTEIRITGKEIFFISYTKFGCLLDFFPGVNGEVVIITSYGIFAKRDSSPEIFEVCRLGAKEELSSFVNFDPEHPRVFQYTILDASTNCPRGIIKYDLDRGQFNREKIGRKPCS
ncbi:MAG: hypothetical protein WCW77_02790 [Patescibacteria group bacterium]